MTKIRIHEIAKELNIASKDLLLKISDLGIQAKSHMSVISEDESKKIYDLYKPKNIESAEKEKSHDSIKETPVISIKEKEDPVILQANTCNLKTEQKPIEIHHKINNDHHHRKNDDKREHNASENIIEIPDKISVGDIAQLIGVSANEIIKILMRQGLMLSINQSIDFNKAKEIAEMYKLIVTEYEAQKEKVLTISTDQNLFPRPPVVTVLGHVDHGKTSLLDAIRQTDVCSTEAGGITQKIGAYTVNCHGKKVVFIDTPGHEAFTAMRARGSKITDIVLIVIAADDGVMPQTSEAIDHAKAAKVPIICVLNKIDKPQANIDRVKQQLADLDLLAEDWGGDIICVGVSAKHKKGLNELLDYILLVAEMQELKANPAGNTQGTIIEAKLDKGLGPVATVLVQNGTLRQGDILLAGKCCGKIRLMINDKGEKINEAGPSTPVEIVGLSEVAQAGDIFEITNDEKVARQIVEKRNEKLKEENILSQKNNLENLFKQMKEGEFKEFNIIIKADNQGSAEALKYALSTMKTEKIGINVIHIGVGVITESDILLASASGAAIIGFNVKPESNILKLSEKENVDIKSYKIIYNVIEDIKLAMTGMLKPQFEEVLIGKAKVKQLIKISKIGIIAGSYVTEGKILRGSIAKVIRDGVVMYEGKISSLKRFKDDVKEVDSNFECGIGVDKFQDIEANDIIESFELKEVKQSLIIK